MSAKELCQSYPGHRIQEGNVEKKLYRSRTDRKLLGVCGGLANYWNIDPTVVRVIAVASILFGTLGIWIYIILALVVPAESS